MHEIPPEPLTPLSFLRRSATMFAERVAVVDGDRVTTYAELDQRARRQAGLLAARGVRPGDRVAVLARNSPMLLESHYGVALAGAVLVAMNVRLSARELSYVIGHSGARVLLYDVELAELADAIEADGLVRISSEAYEAELRGAAPLELPVSDERGLIAINYTSGTTGSPKGVMYHHRGAYLQALAMAAHGRLGPGTVHLWTLPMFHCNGWCFTWAVTAAGGRHVCLEQVEPGRVWRAIARHGVDSLNAAPTVLSDLAWHPDAAPPERPIRVGTGGAPPSPALLERLATLSIDVTHLYGLTETFGPVAICDWQPEWDALSAGRRARLKARQGNANMLGSRLRVIDGDGRDVPADATTMGMIAVRGNNVMLGYFRDDDATLEAAPDGWFRTGDLGVLHPDGYIELRDRAKDVIISGGENIASVEVEQAIAEHPSVLEVAVVGVLHERWGEVPAAFVTLKEGQEATEDEIVEHVRERLARFKAPKSVVFGPLPKTSTGKIQKYLLRESARVSAK